HIFQPRLGPVGAVALIDEHPHHGIGHFGGPIGLHHHAAIPGETAVSGDATEAQPEPDAGLDAETILYLDRLKADVRGIFEHRDHAGAVEADIELARNAVERAVIKDVEVPLARIRSRIDQLLRIDAGGRCAGDVADVVGAGPA